MASEHALLSLQIDGFFWPIRSRRIIQNSHWLSKRTWHDVCVPTACIERDY